MADLDFVGNVAPKVFKDNAQDDKAEFARMQSFIGAITIADMVKTTLGPKGMDKILQSMQDEKRHNITVTNDGATILKSIFIDNPAAKILVDISRTQDEEVGDGTTTVAVLAGELLREAEKLIQMRYMKFNSRNHHKRMYQSYIETILLKRFCIIYG